MVKLCRLVSLSYGDLMCGERKMCESQRRLDGKVVVITGGNAGLGKETAHQLALRGAKVYIACRDPNRAESAIEELKNRNQSAHIIAVKLDLSSFESIREFAKEMASKESQIDILVNNAGVFGVPTGQKTKDDIELYFGTNHLGPFLLTLLLLPLIQKSAQGRIVSLTSSIYAIADIHLDDPNLTNTRHSQFYAYGQSKLANILFIRELAKRLGPDSNVKTYAVHPGAVHTSAQDNLSIPFKGWVISKFYQKPEIGVQTTVYCAVDEQVDNESGHYYQNCTRTDVYPEGKDDQVARQLWELSIELVNLEKEYRL